MDSSLRAAWLYSCCFWQEGTLGKFNCGEGTPGNWQHGQAVGSTAALSASDLQGIGHFCKGENINQLNCVVKAEERQPRALSTYCVPSSCRPQKCSSDRTGEAPAHGQPSG